MADVVNGRPVGPVAEQSTSELVQRASEQLSRLVRDEIALAKAELAEKAKHAGIGAGLFSGSGVLALYGVGALIATAVLVLDIWLPAWAAALIVTVVLFVAAGILALFGKRQFSRAVPPTPQAATQSVRDDVDAVRLAAKDGARHGARNGSRV